MTITIFVIIGLCVGSFLAVIAVRTARQISWISGRSHCDQCGHSLSAADLIPLISFILLRGRCRYCASPIGWSVWLIELCTGIAWGIIAATTPLLSVYQTGLLIFVSASILIVFADSMYGIIPDTATLASLIGAGMVTRSDAWSIAFGIVTALSWIGGIYLLTKKKGMGLGDVKYAPVIGVLCGFPLSAAALYLAFLTGAVVALILIVFRRMSLRGSTIAFGPFLVFAGFVVYLWQNEIIQLAHSLLTL